MKRVPRELSTVVIFSAASLILIFFLLSKRVHQSPMPPALFYGSIGLMLGVIIVQCLRLGLRPRFARVVLVEVTIAALTFHLIYQIPTYGLYGSDAYVDMASLKAIMSSGFIGGVPEYVQITTYFPMFHVLGAQLSLITGINPFVVAKWVPSFIAAGGIPLVYLLTKRIFCDERVALLSALLFASLQHQIIFGSLFIRETIALNLMVCCIYLYISASSSPHPMAYRALSIVCLAGTVAAHHLTSVMLVVFLFIQWLSANSSRLPAIRKLLPDLRPVETISLALVLIAVIGTFIYWITFVVQPVQILTFFVKNVLTPSVWGSGTFMERTPIALSSPRFYIMIYGSYVSYLAFGTLLLYRVLGKGEQRHLETYSFSLFLLLCGITGFASMYLLPATVGGDRFLSFAWLFAFGPVVLTVFSSTRRWIMQIGMFFMIFFVSVNLYTIHPTVWDATAQGSGAAAWEEDFDLAEKFDFSGRVLGCVNDVMAIYYIQNISGRDAFEPFPVDVKSFNWIVMNRASMKEESILSENALNNMSIMQRLEAEGSVQYDRRYESNNIVVFNKR